MDVAAGVTKGVDYLDIDGPMGPVEIDKAHSTLASVILSAPMA